MKILKKLLGTTIWLALLYLGFVVGIEGAANVIVVLCWFIVALSPFMLMDDVVASMAKKPAPAMLWLGHASSGITVVALAWHGYSWLAGLYLFASIMAHSAATAAAVIRARENLKAMAEA